MCQILRNLLFVLTFVMYSIRGIRGVYNAQISGIIRL